VLIAAYVRFTGLRFTMNNASAIGDYVSAIMFRRLIDIEEKGND
jgi:hypothetical protein